MTRLATTHRAGLTAFVIATVVVLAALLIAGLSTIQGRTYALGVPDGGVAGTAQASHRVCEGPIRTPTRATGVGAFADPATGKPLVTVAVFSGGHQIASGSARPNPAIREQVVELDHPIRAGQPVHVCVGASGGTLTVYGSGALAPGVAAHGIVPGWQFALVLTRRTTLIGSLSTAFSRAAIFRPSWMGAWTFWLLLALLVGAFGLAAVALAKALDDPEPDENFHARNGSS
jgi:hypothetical protein